MTNQKLFREIRNIQRILTIMSLKKFLNLAMNYQNSSQWTTSQFIVAALTGTISGTSGFHVLPF